MTTQLQLRRGTTAQNRVFTGAQGELTYDTELKQLRAHDGILNEQTGVMEGTQGGFVFDNSTTVVHKADNETITGIKTFNNVVFSNKSGQWPNFYIGKQTDIANNYSAPSIDISPVLLGWQANDETFLSYIQSGKDTNQTTKCTLNVRNRVSSTGNNRGAQIGVQIDSNGYGVGFAPNPSASSSTSSNDIWIATTSWVNDPTKSTNVVHRTGAETIAGAKTFSDGITGTVTRALWADLAENYVSDEEYPIGTLITFGGEKDITIARHNCNGIISEKPGFLLDHSLENSQPVALVGKTKVRVIGKVNKFDKLVLSSSIPGVAEVKRFENEKVIAIALESSEEDNEKLIMSVVKVNLD